MKLDGTFYEAVTFYRYQTQTCMNEQRKQREEIKYKTYRFGELIMLGNIKKIGFLVLICALTIACQAQVVTETVEVTRIVSETVTTTEEKTVERVVEVVKESYQVEGESVEEEEGEMEEGEMEEAADSAPEPSLPPSQAVKVEQPADMIFEDVGTNPFIDTRDDNLSTFAIDVDTGSYTVMRRYLNDGLLPPSEAVRVEEFVNFFDHQYPIPQTGAFGIHLEAAPAPYGESESYHLLRVGVQGYDVPEEDRPDGLFIFLVDVSGSMSSGNRMGLVKESLRMLTYNLRDTDSIGIVTYGSTAQTILEPTEVANRMAVLSAIDRLETGGGTNMDDGIATAYRLADRYAQAGNINRIILASDGVGNIGATTAEEILRHAKEGIQLSTFGYGMGNYNDAGMEQLANQGDGSYAYIDSLEEAERIFDDQLMSTILTIAKDAKIQIEFNPAVIERYRLIGYENRDVADNDFRNDAVDAGEIGAGHSVTALYEVRFVEDAAANEVAVTARMRFEDLDTTEVVELSQSMAYRDVHATFRDASATFQLDAVVVEYAEILSGSFWAHNAAMGDIVIDARRIAEYLPDDADVQEFASMVAQAAELIE
ncbi:MAG: Ca-activated chloride channel family protein [Candidatus Promineifilaceae bacterium]